uniref:Uncharacterized protein n=1 Tax=Arundo donax TaxID=35708 RepID=A0A0A9BB96_ARUDO
MDSKYIFWSKVWYCLNFLNLTLVKYNQWLKWDTVETWCVGKRPPLARGQEFETHAGPIFFCKFLRLTDGSHMEKKVKI